MAQLPDFPVVVAMKGHPFTGKSTIARQIAKMFKWPVIDEDDIRSSFAELQQPLEPQQQLTDQLMEDICFKTVCQVAQTQLKMGFNIVIDSNSLSRNRVRLDRLLELSDSYGAVLVLFECKPEVKAPRRKWLDWQRANDVSHTSRYPYKPSTWEDLVELTADGRFGDYDDGDVRKVTADSTLEMVNMQVVFPLLELARSQIVYHLHVNQWTDQNYCANRDPNRVAETRHSPRNHVIVLTFSSGEDDGISRRCDKCSEPIILGSEAYFYSCTHCNLYLHKSCAEEYSQHDPEKKKLELLPRDRLPFVGPSGMEMEFSFQKSRCFIDPSGLQMEYTFPKTHRCHACQEENKDFSYDCEGCVFQTHLHCDLIPTAINCHQGHEHPLLLKISQLWAGFVFSCVACGNHGKHFIYCCSTCNFACHVNCAFLPLVVNHKRHVHPLNLTFSTPREDFDEIYCDACETERNPKHWFYGCSKCSYTCHLTCVVPSCP